MILLQSPLYQRKSKWVVIDIFIDFLEESLFLFFVPISFWGLLQGEYQSAPPEVKLGYFVLETVALEDVVPEILVLLGFHALFGGILIFGFE